MTIPHDNQKALIQLNGEFSAADLEEIIRDIARARAAIIPPVPIQPPAHDSDDEILVQSDAKFSVRTLVDGGARVWLRNEGVGWLAFTLTAADKDRLVNFLSQRIGHTHTSH